METHARGQAGAHADKYVKFDTFNNCGRIEPDGPFTQTNKRAQRTGTLVAGEPASVNRHLL
eukprot:1191277-Prorocentrum_minimum.AAC.1